MSSWPWSRFPEAADYDATLARRRRRWRWIFAGAAAVLLLGLWLSWRWWDHRLVETGLAQAEQAAARGEWRTVNLLLEQVHERHPLEPRVVRAIAQFYTRLGDPQGLAHWRTLNRLDPANEADWIGTATAAVGLKEIATARAALDRVPATTRDNVNWLRPAVALALLERDQPALVRHLTTWHRVAPEDLQVAVHLQIARLDDPAAATRQEARAELGRLARVSPHRITATLALLASGQKPDAPESLSLVLQRIFPQLQLDEKRARVALLEHMKQQPAPQVPEVLALVRHLAELGRAGEARDWLAGLPANVQSVPPVLDAQAGLCADLEDWPALHAALARGAWGASSPALVEAAFAAQGFFARGERAEGQRKWRQLLQSTQSDLQSTNLLVRLAVLWRQPEAARLALRPALAAHTVAPATLARLARLAAETGDTETLWQALTAWHQAEPGFPGLADRRLYIGALHGTLSPAERAELAAAPPADPPFLRAAQGLIALQEKAAPARLTELQDGMSGPATTTKLVRSLLLQRLGQAEQAQAARAGLPTEGLLPEEKSLLDSSRPVPAR